MTHTSAPPFVHTSGPLDARIALVGEAFGRDEELSGAPFVGAAGQELTRLLAAAGIKRAECFITNLLAFRPAHNNLLTLCGTRKDIGRGYTLPSFYKQKYLLPEYLPELERLREELSQCSANIIVALGGSALWGLMRTGAISAYRGTTNLSTLLPGRKLLPTFHPSFVLQNWKTRTVVIADLMKAERDSHFPEIRRPDRDIKINPTIADIQAWLDAHYFTETFAVDIETKNSTMTSIAFAASPSDALVIPFWDQTEPGRSYWSTPGDEIAALKLTRELLRTNAAKLFHNGMFDVQYLSALGMPPKNFIEDTMIYQHALFPEQRKGLGFLGSLYSGLGRNDGASEGAWKMEGRAYENKDIEPKSEE